MMKIGLVRHFKVRQAYPKKLLVGYDELAQWFDNYELADVEHQNVELCGVSWDKCYSSSASRALKTAERIFAGEVIKRDDLKELNFLPLMNKRYKLPLILWAILIRNKSRVSNQVTDEFATRVSAFVDELLKAGDKNVLVASHGFVMMFLQKELLKRGFRGDRFNTPANGKIYVFEQ